MTWQARFTVQDVGEGPAPIDVIAAVAAAEEVALQQPGVPLVGAVLTLQVGADETPLRVGDQFTVTGHFPVG